MENPFLRTQMFLGLQKFNILQTSRVAVFGVGGVGGFALEALARTGVGAIDLYDGDTVSLSNLNRQIIATTNTVGGAKVQVAKDRILSINPSVKVEIFDKFLQIEDVDKIDLSAYDYVIDAIDTVSVKLALIQKANKQNVNIISCMGTGGKLDISRLKVADINKTSGCPLARVIRRELKKTDVKKLKVVYSDENIIKPHEVDKTPTKADGKNAPPSMIFVPAVAGLMLSCEVVKDLTATLNKE